MTCRTSTSRDLAVADGDHAVGIEAAHMAAGDARVHRMDLATGHQFGFFHGALDRLHGGFDVHDHALLQAARGMRAQAHHFDRAVDADLADQRHDLGGADIQTHDQRTVTALSHWPPLCLLLASRWRSRWHSADRHRRSPLRAWPRSRAAASMKRSKRSSTCCRPRRSRTPLSSTNSQAPRSSSRSRDRRMPASTSRGLHGQVARRSSAASEPGGPDQFRQFGRNVPRVVDEDFATRCSAGPASPQRATGDLLDHEHAQPRGQLRATLARSTQGICSHGCANGIQVHAHHALVARPALRTAFSTSSGCTRWKRPATSHAFAAAGPARDACRQRCTAAATSSSAGRQPAPPVDRRQAQPRTRRLPCGDCGGDWTCARTSGLHLADRLAHEAGFQHLPAQFVEVDAGGARSHRHQAVVGHARHGVDSSSSGRPV